MFSAVQSTSGLGTHKGPPKGLRVQAKLRGLWAIYSRITLMIMALKSPIILLPRMIEHFPGVINSLT